MIQFTIKKDQINRLKILLDYIKKMENFSPLDSNQMFILNKDKLMIYGISSAAGAGHIEAIFDVSSQSDEIFGMELNKFITYLEKIKSDEIIVEIQDDKINFKSKTSKTQINQALVYTKPEEVIIKEIKNRVSSLLNEPEFENPIFVDLTFLYVMESLGSVTKLRNANFNIKVGKNTISSTDDLCIIELKTDKQVASEEDILLDREFLSVLKKANQIQLSSDKKYVYLDIPQQGIKLFFVPRVQAFECLTEDDISYISPDPKNNVVFKINSKLFYEKLDDFYGVFESTTWKYEQVFMNVSKGKPEEIELQFDNMVVEVRNKLQVETISDIKDDASFLVATNCLRLVQSVLTEEEYFTLSYTNVDINDEHGAAVKIENSKVTILVTKINE